MTLSIAINGEPKNIAQHTLADALIELGYENQKIATAVNEVFVSTSARATHALNNGDRVEILTAQQGG